MKTSTKLLSMLSAFCAIILLGMTANAQSITVTPSLTATQMAQELVGSNVTVTNAVYTGAPTASGSFTQGTSSFLITDGIILTSGSANNALGPNNSTGSSTSNNTPGDAILNGLTGGTTTFDAAVLEFDIVSNCNSVTFDYIFASEEYPEYGCSNFNDAFGFFITGPGYTPNTNIALVPGTSVPVSINNVINSPSTNCVSNPTYYVDNAGGTAIQYDGHTVVLTATATIQPCQTYHVKIVVADAGDSALDSAIFLKGGGINCTSPGIATNAVITPITCGGGTGAIDLSVNSGTGPFTYAWTGPNGFTATTEDISGLAAGDYTVDITGSDCLSSGQETFTVTGSPDVTAPTFTSCPSNIVIESANGLCTYGVNLTTPPTATDNCSVVSLVPSVGGNDIDISTYQFGAGTTTVTYTATDAAGNSSTCTFDVNVNAQPLEVTLTPFQYNGGVNIRCFGELSGRVTACASGGCAPYTYSWSAGTTAPFPAPPGCETQWQLGAGIVTCTVTDAAGTSVTELVTLIENPPVTATAVWAPIQCFGGTTTVNINVAGGTPNNQGGYNGVTTYNNVFPGQYSYTVADGNGCRANDAITITQPDELVATSSQTQILCFGETSDVTIGATGGTMPYTGVGVDTVLAGNYTYTVTDANGCTDDIQVDVTQPGQLTASASSTPIPCFGDTALVTVSVISGTEPYTGTGVFPRTAGTWEFIVFDFNLCQDTVIVELTQPTQMVASATTTSIACAGDSATINVTGSGGTGVWTGTGTFVEPAGTYDYNFTDENGCTASLSVVLTEPDSLVVTATAGTILCNGETADVTVSATGGTAPYTGTGTFNVGAGTYTYTVTDANGCTDTVSITVTEPAALVASISATTIDCNGGTADVTVSATGGTAPYTGTGTFNVTAGTYTYTVTDANGCSETVSITLTEPSALVASVSATSIDCNGGTADVTVSATGGTAPYTGTGTFNVSAGTYTYIVTDANGCSETVSIPVAEPTPLVASVSADSILCNGDLVDVTVSATGGTAPYTGTGVFNVGAGTHTYTVTDANGCSETVSITLTEPAALQAFSSCPAPVLCAGDSATIAVTAFGGTAPYTGIGVFFLTAGTYDFVVTDANGCTDITTHVITEPAPLAVSATATSIDCNGGTADVTVTASGGTAPYTGEGTFNVSAGTYTYTVTDANGCSETVTITVTEPAPLVASATADMILCFGGTADITVTATGGTAPYTGTGVFNEGAGTYTYTITDANGCTATTTVTLTEPTELMAFISCPVIDCNGGTADMAVFAFGGTPPYTNTGIYNVGAGTYTYVVTDANGCTDTVTHTVTEPAPIVVTITSTGIDCNGGTADVTVTASGGTPTYTGTGTFTGLSAGTYIYTVTDANGCTETASITITEPTPLMASTTAGTILCNGGTVDVTVSATGGTAPYTGVGTFNVGVGTYTYTVTDANGCTATTSVTLAEPSALQAFASCPAILCNGGTTNIGVTAFGGTPPYTGDIGVFNVGAGTYTYTITDANGCTATVTHTVTEPAPLAVNATATSIDCNGGTADVTVTASGGTAPYTGTGTFTGLSAGTYSYTVTDANGCTETVSVTVTEPSSLVASATAGTILCNGGTANVVVSATGGTAPYTGTGTFSETAGTYTYTVTDANGCSGTVSITVSEPTPLVVSVSCPAPIACSGGTTDVFVSATGGTAGYTGTGTFTVSAGTHTFTVTDANGCTETVSIVVTEPSPLVVTVTSGGVNCSTGNAYVTISASGGTAPYTGTGTVCVVAGTYTYTVTDANGCTGTETITISPCAPNYCASYATCSAYEWINNVTLGSINNTSGNNGGYGDFSSMVTTASPGDNINLQLTPGFSGQSYTEAWRIWVDWNNDGDFYDQGEFIGQGYGSGTLTGWITVPQFAVQNTNLRVRVSMQWACHGYPPGPCCTFTYGEVEDYSIHVASSNGMMVNNTINAAGKNTVFAQNETAGFGPVQVEGTDNEGSSNKIFDQSLVPGVGIEIGHVYPNPVSAANGKFNLELRAGEDTDVTIRIVDLSGKVMYSDVLYIYAGANKRVLDATGFSRGTYLIEVIAGDLKGTTQLVVQ